MIKNILIALLVVWGGCVDATNQPSSYSIVYVHLGEQLPTYLLDALVQARRFNDVDAAIIIIAEQKALDAIDWDIVQSYAITTVACESLIETEAHKRFKEKSSFARPGAAFWFRCTERFFYINELMHQENLSNVFHMEYDNMMYVDLHELLPVFATYKNIAAVFDADYRCIPSFMFFAQYNSLDPLVGYIADNAHKGKNDMQIISLFKNENEPAVIDHLPIIIPEYAELYELKNKGGKTTLTPERYMQNVAAFDSIFDAAAIGQYLGGIDPKNGPSKPGFINETCLFNPSYLDFTWQLDAQGRKIPYASIGSKKYRINNLHIHSKNLKAFVS